MKLLHCKLCGDIVAPDRRPRVARYCACKSFALWWEAPQLGILKVWTENPSRRNMRSLADVSILGLHNGLLRDPSHVTHRKYVEQALDETPESYIFHRSKAGSLIAQFYVGYTSDVSWAEALPEAS